MDCTLERAAPTSLQGVLDMLVGPGLKPWNSQPEYKLHESVDFVAVMCSVHVY